MYLEEATIKRRSKTNKTRRKNGIIKESKTEIIEIKGLSIKSDFRDNEEVIILKKDDLNQILEKEKKITQYEGAINELRMLNAELEEEVNFLKKMNVPAPSNRELEQNLLYNLMLNNAIEEAIKIIASNASNEINEANTSNIKEFEQLYKNVKSDIDKQNNTLIELKTDTINIIDNLNNSIVNFNKELQTTNRFKLLFNKNKLFLDLDTAQLKEALEQINKLELINIADFKHIVKLLEIPNIGIDNSEVREELETKLNKLQNELKKDLEEEIINI